MDLLIDNTLSQNQFENHLKTVNKIEINTQFAILKKELKDKIRV